MIVFFPNPDQKVRGMYKIFLSKACQVGHRYIFQGVIQGTPDQQLHLHRPLKICLFTSSLFSCLFLTSFLHPTLSNLLIPTPFSHSFSLHDLSLLSSLQFCPHISCCLTPQALFSSGYRRVDSGLDPEAGSYRVTL